LSWHHLGRRHLLSLLLRSSLDEPVSLDKGLALSFGELTDRRKVGLQVDVAIIKRFFDDAHAVLQGRNFAMELDELL